MTSSGCFTCLKSETEAINIRHNHGLEAEIHLSLQRHANRCKATAGVWNTGSVPSSLEANLLLFDQNSIARAKRAGVIEVDYRTRDFDPAVGAERAKLLKTEVDVATKGHRNRGQAQSLESASTMEVEIKVPPPRKRSLTSANDCPSLYESSDDDTSETTPDGSPPVAPEPWQSKASNAELRAGSTELGQLRPSWTAYEAESSSVSKERDSHVPTNRALSNVKLARLNGAPWIGGLAGSEGLAFNLASSSTRPYGWLRSRRAADKPQFLESCPADQQLATGGGMASGVAETPKVVSTSTSTNVQAVSNSYRGLNPRAVEFQCSVPSAGPRSLPKRHESVIADSHKRLHIDFGLHQELVQQRIYTNSTAANQNSFEYAKALQREAKATPALRLPKLDEPGPYRSRPHRGQQKPRL